MWFPKPAAPADLRIVGAPGSLDSSELFGILTDETGVEWRDKVGVAGSRDGSAKSSSRLLASQGWVLKTDMESAASCEGGVWEHVEAAARLAGTSSFWHPGKVWAVFEADQKWYPLSATPELETIRQVNGSERKVREWTAMLELYVNVARKNGIGLDLNPSNFAYAPERDRLYYIDDEWYARPTFLQVASGIVGRIPEEPDIGESTWGAWGSVLFNVLAPLCPDNESWADLVDKIDSHPMAAAFGSKRIALREGIRNAHPEYRRRKQKLTKQRKRSSQESATTAVIADVHGNLAALEAVLAECKSRAVDGYLFVGDAVGYGPQPQQCIRILAELPNAKFVRGNHDHAIGTGVLRDGMNRLARSCADWTYNQLNDEERQWLLEMPLDVRGQGWLAVHGAPKDPRRFLAYVYELTYQDNLAHMAADSVHLCFCGHTHVQFAYEMMQGGASRKLGAPESIEVRNNRILLVNPGSVGQPRDGDSRAAYAIWNSDTNDISLHRVSYEVELVVDAIKAEGLPAELGDRLLDGR